MEPLPTPRLPLDQLALTVSRTLPDTVSVTGITVPSDSTRSYTVLLSAPRGAGVLVDPYRGTILGRSDRTPFFATVRRLHRWLLWSKPTDGDGPSWGRIIVGTSVLLFVFSLLTGLLAWWPKQLKGLGRRLKIHTDKGRPRLMHELCMAAIAGDAKGAMQLQRRLMPLHRNLFVEANPIPVKWALSRLGRCGGALRLPLTPLTPASQAKVEQALKDSGLL